MGCKGLPNITIQNECAIYDTQLILQGCYKVSQIMACGRTVRLYKKIVHLGFAVELHG